MCLAQYIRRGFQDRLELDRIEGASPRKWGLQTGFGMPNNTMSIKLHFLGASSSVTGSSYLIEANNQRILVDCGMFQERDLQDRNYDPFPISPKTINNMLLTHAHLDHCGRVPKLVAEGFGGNIYTTRASAKIAEIIMTDSARIQEEDLKYKVKRLKRQGRKPKYPMRPLYTSEDAKAATELLRHIEMEKEVEVGKGITARFHEAGHILGACHIMVTVTTDSETKRILFSGDIGRWDQPILRDPSVFDAADYVLTESTYGNRLHEPNYEIPEKLEKIVNDTMKRGGNLIIPSFAVERSQDLLYHLSTLRNEKKIPPVLVFLDSPMAIKVTQVFKDNADLFDAETVERLEKGDHPVEFQGLVLCRSAEQSKAINRIRGSAIVIAGAGMCNGGRIKHHLRNNISNPDSTVLFVGYQAIGTLGRQIIEKPEKIRLFGEEQMVRAEITKINGFSGHADRDELLRWISSLKKAPKRVFVTHGDEKVAKTYAEFLTEKLGFDTHVPKYQEVVELD